MTTRPNPLPGFYVWLTYLLLGPLMLILTAVCATTALLVSIADKNGRVQHWIAHFWGRTMVRLSLSPLKIEGEANFRKFPVAVYVSNHTSYMDTPVIFGAIPFQFRILAKKDLWQWPMIGWYLGRSGQMPIDLANPHATLSSLGGAVKALRAGMPLFVFPEGGRTSDGELRPFLAGAAYLAIRAQVPIVPIALSGVYDLLPIHTKHFYPCRLTVRVGEPIETTGMHIRQNVELTDRVRNIIEDMRIKPASSPAESPAPAA
jgi:1-acyl-sn-glycerol-3-phosphate acyltransferase